MTKAQLAARVAELEAQLSRVSQRESARRAQRRPKVLLIARYETHCQVCGELIAPGETIGWAKFQGSWHFDCIPDDVSVIDRRGVAEARPVSAFR